MHIYMFIYIIHTLTHIYLYVYRYIHIHIHTHMYTYTHIYISKHEGVDLPVVRQLQHDATCCNEFQRVAVSHMLICKK